VRWELAEDGTPLRAAVGVAGQSWVATASPGTHTFQLRASTTDPLSVADISDATLIAVDLGASS